MAIVNPNVAAPVGLVNIVGGVGIGDVSGPGVAVDGNFAAFQGVTGKEIEDSGIAKISVPNLQKGQGQTWIVQNPAQDMDILNIDGDFKTNTVNTATFSSIIELSNTFRDKDYQELIIKDFSENAAEKIIRIRREDGAPIDGANELLINTNGGEVRVAAYAGGVHTSNSPTRQITSFGLLGSDKNIFSVPSSASTSVARVMWETSTQQLKIFKDTPAAEALKISFRNNYTVAGVQKVFPGSGPFTVTDAEFIVAGSAYFSEGGVLNTPESFAMVQAQDTIALTCLIDFGNNDFFYIDLSLKLSANHFNLVGSLQRVLL